MTEPQDSTNEGVKKLSEDEQRDLLSKIRLRYEKGVGANELNRRNHTADLEFIYAADQMSQWDPAVLQLRAGRPSYSFNRVLQPVNMIIGDQRQTRPAVKVRPSSQNATSTVADIFGGLWRAIWRDSRGEELSDEAYKQSVGGGFGEMMMLPEFENDQSFDQVLRLRNIPNPLTVVRDAESTDPCGADAMWAMVGGRISKEKYEELYPGHDPATFAMARDSFGWRTEDMIRVVDYFEKIAVVKEIAELDDGRIIDYTDKEKAAEKHLQKVNPDGNYAKVKRTRKVKGWSVRWVRTDGAHVLEGPIDYDWQRIPVVRMPGRYINIEGKQLLQSFVRHAWDSQRSYNFQRSDSIERSALGVKAPILYTPKMVTGFDDIWSNAHVTPRVGLPFNVDKDSATNGGAPFRLPPIDPPAASSSMATLAAQDIQATTGMFDPALGNADDMNRVSGKALVTHTRRSDLGSHEFIDGYGKCLQLLCEMAMDMIPTIYDSKRIVHILDGDDTEKLVPINHDDGSGNIINDLKAGRYSCTVTLGPSYQTARQETLATLLDAAEKLPVFGQVAPDIIAKSIDDPNADEIAKRIRTVLIKQGIVQPTPQEKAQAGPPPQPNPMQVAELQRAQALAARDMANAHIAASKAGVSDIEIHRLVTDIANKHLSNIVLAQKIGTGIPEVLAAHAEAQAGQPAPAAPGVPNQ